MNDRFIKDDTHVLSSHFYSNFKEESEWLKEKRKEVIARFSDKLLINNPNLKINLRGPTVLV
jgi:hypothetical protein